MLAEVLQNRDLSTTTTGFTDVDDTPFEIEQFDPHPFDASGTSSISTLPPIAALCPSTSRSATTSCMIVS